MKRGKLITTIVLLVCLLLLTACGPSVPSGETPTETGAALQQVRTGTQGVEITTLQNYPPATIYDENDFSAIIEIKNKGNYDLEPGDCFVQVTGFNPSIIRGGLNIPRSCGENYGVLEGKNIYNLQGSVNTVEFKSVSSLLPEGVPDYTPTLNFMTCYNYHTKASPEVCVDPAFYQVTSEQKVCTPQNVGMGGGQGGPVGVGYVGVNMVGSTVIFDINVRNLGTGRVLSPMVDFSNCGDAAYGHADFDKVLYSVDLIGSSMIDCKPRNGIVPLTNGNGKIVCKFDVHQSSAYETPLIIDLEYNYMQSFRKPVRIVKTPQ